MGDIADYYVEEAQKDLFYNPIKKSSPISYTNPQKRGGRGMYNRPYQAEYNNVERKVEKKFKLQNGEKGSYAIVIEQGLSRETVAVSFDRTKFRAKGFITSADPLFNRGEFVEKINMHDVFTGFVNTLNNLFSADLLCEATYNAIVDGYEPFIMEALEFSEIQSFLEPTVIGEKKKKRIKQRGRA